MEEKILTGYCRGLDRSRMVTAEQEDGAWVVDCGFEGCPFAESCQIARQIRELG